MNSESNKDLDRYTSTAFRINNLKKHAKTLAKGNPDLSFREALELKAKEAGFQSWNQLIKEPFDAEREEVYTYAFQNQAALSELFTRYCERHSLQKNSKTYRSFVIYLYKTLKAGLKKRSQFDVNHKEIVIDSFLKEWLGRLEQFGIEAILPQNIPEYLLVPAIKYLSLPLAPRTEASQETTDEDYGIKVMCESAILLYTAYKYENGENVNLAPYEIDYETLFEVISQYKAILYVESIHRKYKFVVGYPALSNLFDKDAEFIVNVVPDFLETIFAQHPE